MIRVFPDTSVLLAAILSTTGASREIVRLALEETVGLVLNGYVLKEMQRTLERKAPAGLPAFEDLLRILSFELVTPSKGEVLAAARFTESRDAPIVAAAMKAGVDYLVTLDRKHLVDQPEVARGFGLQIVLPGDLLHILRSTD